MQRKWFVTLLTGSVVLSIAMVAIGGDPQELVTDKDRQDLLAALQQLRSRRMSATARGILDEVELRCHALFVLTNAGINGRASLQILEEAKQSSLIALGLFHSSPAIRMQALQALVRLNDRTVVPSLVRALENNNYQVLEGSEVGLAHRNFKKELVGAIEKFIGITLDATDFDDQRQIVRAIDKTKQWLQGSTGSIQPSTHAPRAAALPY